MAEEEEKHKDNQKLEHEGWNDFKEKERGCTDILCLFLIIAVWVAMTFVGFVVCGVIQDDRLPPGNPVRLTHAIDYKGDICGFHDGVKGRDKAYYMPDLSVVCQKSCPSRANYTAFICKDEYQADADKSVVTGYEYVSEFKCMYVVKTKEYLYRCLPDLNVESALSAAKDAAIQAGGNLTESIVYDTENKDGEDWLNFFVGDLLTLRGYVFGFGIGVATFVAFLYLFFLRIPGLLTFFIWGGILAVFLFLLVGSFLLWDLANQWANDDIHSDPEVVTMRVFAYIGFIVTALYFCLILVMRKRLQLAIGIVKQTAKALATMPGILLFPVLQVLGLIIFLIPWLIYVFYTASSGEVTSESRTIQGSDGNDIVYTYRTFSYTQNTQYAFLFLLFCWFWTSEFIVAVGQLVIALCFSAWYFTREKSNISSLTVHWAVRVTFMYHVGTAAYGSLIIAIIKTIRAVISYIQKKAKKSGNAILQYILCMIQCCMWCLEKIMKFINKHAYIITAIYGYSFCKSARKAFFLLLRNILRVAAVNMISSVLLFLGKLFVPITSTFLCYLAIAYGAPDSEVSGIIAPLFVTFLLSYWISSMFMEIFGMGIETILFCYIADEEMFEPADRYATGDLQTTLQKTAQKAAKNKIQDEPSSDKQEEAPVVKTDE